MRVAIGMLLVVVVSVAYGESTLLRGQDGQVVQPTQLDSTTPATAEPTEPISPEPTWNTGEQSVVQPSSEVRWIAPHNPLTADVQGLIAKFKGTTVSVSLTVIDIVKEQTSIVLVAFDSEHNLFKLSCDENLEQLVDRMHKENEVFITAKCVLDDVKTEYVNNGRRITIIGQAKSMNILRSTADGAFRPAIQPTPGTTIFPPPLQQIEGTITYPMPTN